MIRLCSLVLIFFSLNAWALPGEDFAGEGSCICKAETCSAEEILYLSNHCQSPVDAAADTAVNILINNNIFLCPGCTCAAGEFGIKDEFHLPSKYRKLGGSYAKKKTMLTCHQLDSLDIEKVISCVTSDTTLVPCPLNIQVSGCSKLDVLLPPTLIACYEAKRNCGFGWKNFRTDGNYKKFYKNLRAIKEDRSPLCYKSMCTSTTFEAFVMHMKQALLKGKITQEQFEKHTKWKNGSLGYDHINLNATPDALVEELGIGSGHQQHRSELGSNNIPKTGDLIQLWRRSGSGHSAVFKGLVDIDGDNKNDLLCYVSSQSSTNGVGENCEEIKGLDRVLIGSLDELNS